MKKRILAISLVVAMLAVAVIGGSLAYFTDTDEAVNTFTVGNVKIKIDETDIKNPESNVRVPGNTYENLVPGKEVLKDPIVHNVGSTDAYVRVKVRVENALNWIGYAVGGQTDFSDDAAVINALFGPLGEGWAITNSEAYGPMWGDPGYSNDFIYTITYNGPLAPKTSTTPVFEKFVFPANLTQEQIPELVSEDGTMHVSVTAEAVQTETFESAAEAFAASFDKPAAP